MLRKLEIESLSAELASATRMLELAKENADFIGEMQIGVRIKELLEEIGELEIAEEPTASMALFFSGRPVLGSKGVDAKFASDALESFQSLLTKHFASMEFDNPMGTRGPIKASGEAKLMVTDIARGSFGFVMEEAPEQTQLVRTNVGEAISNLSSTIAKLSSQDDDWSDAVAAMDQRLVNAVNHFFCILDEAGASVRIVEGAHDRALSREDVNRGRLRTESTTVTESETGFIDGVLTGFSSRGFDFTLPSGESISGKIEKEPARKITMAGEGGHIDQLLFTKIKANFRKRLVEQANWSRIYYTLVSIDDRSDTHITK